MSARVIRGEPALVAQCGVCGYQKSPVAAVLSVCADCIRQRPGQVQTAVQAAQGVSRCEFGLPVTPPTDGDVACQLCVNACHMTEGERGFCNLRQARGGRLVNLAGTPAKGLLHWYTERI